MSLVQMGVLMDKLLLYRKRIIPAECVLLKDDELLVYNDEVIVTKWRALKPKKTLHHGYSCYFLERGYKVSKFYRADNTLLYWYCDIVKYDFSADRNKLIVTDLLADVLIFPNGFVKVVDLDEIVPALESGGLSLEDMKKALLNLNSLLSTIYHGKFNELTLYIDRIEQ